LAVSEILVAALLAALLTSAAAEPALFESRQLTPSGEYTFGIEGPAVDATGTLYVVNFGKQGTIGALRPGASMSELFTVLPEGSVGNAIRFDRDGRMYVADYKNHNVFVLERGQKEPRVYFHSDQFNQPNDLTVAVDGTIYASDPHWRRRDGQIWRITRGPDGTGVGEVMSTSAPTARPSMSASPRRARSGPTGWTVQSSSHRAW
jgi:sugar lactone lactonase YvrE